MWVNYSIDKLRKSKEILENTWDIPVNVTRIFTERAKYFEDYHRKRLEIM